jgi:hypothetical protein
MSDILKFKFRANDLFSKIGEYVTHIETGVTREVCRCEWSEVDRSGHFQKIAESLECPVHTKEGFLLGFFRWAFPDAQITGVIEERDMSHAKDHTTMNSGEVIQVPYATPEPHDDLPAVLKARIAESGFRVYDGD